MPNLRSAPAFGYLGLILGQAKRCALVMNLSKFHNGAFFGWTCAMSAAPGAFSFRYNEFAPDVPEQVDKLPDWFKLAYHVFPIADPILENAIGFAGQATAATSVINWRRTEAANPGTVDDSITARFDLSNDFGNNSSDYLFAWDTYAVPDDTTDPVLAQVTEVDPLPGPINHGDIAPVMVVPSWTHLDSARLWVPVQPGTILLTATVTAIVNTKTGKIGDPAKVTT